MGKLIALLIIVLLSGPAFSQTTPLITASKAEAQSIGKLKNLYKIDDGIYRSAQPGSSDFALFEKNGIKEVLNLRRLRDDKKKAKGTSLILHHISMKAGDIDNQEVTTALKLIKDRKGPLLIHCWHGSDRTGMLCAMYRILFQGWSKDEAITEMTKGNFGFHSGYSNIITYIRNANLDKMKKDVFGDGKMITATATTDLSIPTTMATIQ